MSGELGHALGVTEEDRRVITAWRQKSEAEQLAYFESRAPRRAPCPDGRVRVGFLCPCLIQGGLENQQLALARFADRDRVTFPGCCVVDPNAPIDDVMRAQTSALMPVTVGYAAAHRMARRCDVLVTSSIGGMAALMKGQPDPPAVVGVVHVPPESDWGQHDFARPEGIDHWVAVSELALESIPTGSRSVPTSVIWNAIDPGRLVVRRSRAEMRALWGVPEGSPVVGYFGRLSPEKDPAAIIRLAGSLPNLWHAVIVGQGRHHGYLADMIAAKGLSRVHLVGPDPSPGDVLNAFDTLVVPSHYESFGLTLAEGIAAGLPIVATRSGLAKLVPGIVEEVPVRADGPTLASAVLAAFSHGPKSSAKALIPRLAPERFGREWTDLVVSMARPRRAERPMDTARLAMLAELCPAGTGPCGCNGVPNRSCGDPDRPSLVSKADCLLCQARRWWELGVEAGW